ncbi:MAG: TIGR03663 family protein [Leptolinea sp.]|jgi:predicted membrane-bound mannosyltransferase/DNA-binding beta-propeller fold protein YncE|nr:TIGR03663 family protein [Leptolinea sp.]
MNLSNSDVQAENPQPGILDKPLMTVWPAVNLRMILGALILVLAVVSRFYNLDLRVMSHDEVNHVVPSYDLYTGKGYRHDPVTHGPMQFHLVAASYFMLGDSDFSSRVPAALFSIAAIAFILFKFPRYLGKNGALIAAFLFLISPFMLFYGRYTRNEGFIELLGVMLLYGTLAYLETGKKSYFYLITTALVLHFCSKETSYIYTAILLVFLAFNFLRETTELKSLDANARRRFTVFMLAAGLAVLIALGAGVWGAGLNKPADDGLDAATTATMITTMPVWIQSCIYGGIAAALVFGVLALFNLAGTIGWDKIRKLRSFDLLVLIVTLILPQLVALPVKLIGWNPLDYSDTGMIRTGSFIIVLFILSVIAGYWWNKITWLKNAALFYTIYILLYTTFFTNGRGFFTGIVGSLGYWLAQQGVQRGSQPWYFYGLIQIPFYEYLAAFGTILALYFGLRHNRLITWSGDSPADPDALVREHELETPDWMDDAELEHQTETRRPVPTLALLIFWDVMSLIAYSVAGEKMPWIAVHIALPLLLTAGWGLGYLVDTTPWKRVANRSGMIALALIPCFLMAFAGAVGALLGDKTPFNGNTLENLEATSTFILSVLMTAGSLFGILRLLWNFGANDLIRLFTAGIAAILTVLTIRTTVMANYINYDTPKEYLVYAHAARGPKDMLAQIEEISRRTTGGKDIVVEYDNDALYPFWWYMRDYPNHRWYTDKPTRELKDAPIVIAGDANFDKVNNILKNDYIQYTYMRLWWPNQDYFNLDWPRIKGAFLNPEMRAAIFNIWLNHDYTAYAKVTNNQNLTLETWQPSAKLRLYIRKDIISQIWNYGAAPAAPVAAEVDPYQGKLTRMTPDRTIGGQQEGAVVLNKPRNLAVAADGSIYVADSANHQIKHISADGKLLQAWGKFADISKGDAPGGTFYEPWAVAIGKDGSIFVTDTWNHRIQKFTADGKFLKMWGFFGQAEKPEGFWGPRGLAVDARGNVLITDTGNKRVVVFTSEGEYVTQFGQTGMEPGQFDEPVGITISNDGEVYVADTWNSRIQVFTPDASGLNYTFNRSWELEAWSGQSLDNKPFIAIDSNNHLYVTDPEGYRVLVFDQQGQYLMGWGDYSTDIDGFGLASGVAVDPNGGVWVSDGGNNRLLHFVMPPG